MLRTAISLLLLLTVCSCNDTNVPFAITFSMESINNYKATVSIDSAGNYTISRQNYFFDSQSGTNNYASKKGQLNAEEYTELKRVVAGSDLTSMKDSYGFEAEPAQDDPYATLLYQIQYTEAGRTKNITIRPGQKQKYDKDFVRLLSLLTGYISSYS
jgi:hypothetical protein